MSKSIHVLKASFRPDKASPVNVIPFPNCTGKPVFPSFSIKESEFCFLLVIGMYQSIHGLSQEMADGMSTMFFKLRESFITERDCHE
ncbi:hypothetical protein [Desulfobacula phenolica]|uniref:Uncharacterized protein n=1 Tax=Desulfobacula phenolica TaxID=90732 RepID=A0A1H2I3C7_9BACT|nr:hypothetical protein [Desulfobacula phenolica]SDU38569.1 hypothetical protein SAMN04487931_107208 [Desulfobacula phenolica]